MVNYQKARSLGDCQKLPNTYHRLSVDRRLERFTAGCPAITRDHGLNPGAVYGFLPRFIRFCWIAAGSEPAYNPCTLAVSPEFRIGKRCWGTEVTWRSPRETGI